MPKYRRGSGSVYKKRGVFYIAYYTPAGKQVCESAKTKDKVEARRILRSRLGEIADSRYVGPAAERVTFEELAEMFLNDYRVNGKTIQNAEIYVHKHLAPFFGKKKAGQIATADVEGYKVKRQEEGAANGSINRELAALKRMFNLALQAERIVKKPHIPMLAEDNVRQGFFERWEFERVLAKVPDCLCSPFAFAYITGWRMKKEVLRLTWPQVDFETGLVRLEAGTTKNKKGRAFYFTADLRALLESQWQERITKYPNCPLVFHDHGQPIVNYAKRWKRACQESGLMGKIVHDFRRTAVRNPVRAGVPERVAMEMPGHKTRSVFDRYHIVSDGDLKEAASRLEKAAALQTTLSTTLSVVAERRRPAGTTQMNVLQ